MVGVEHRRVNHNSVVVEVAHEAHGLEVKDFQGAVFTRGEEPLVVLLELKSCDVASVPLKKSLLVDNLTGASLGDFVDFDRVVGSDPEVLAVLRHCKLVDLRGWVVDGDLHLGQARVHVPKLD